MNSSAPEAAPAIPHGAEEELSPYRWLILLMRQIEGSFGIAYLGTIITNSTAAHRAVLATHLYPGNPVFDDRMNLLQGAFRSRGYDAPSAHDAALSILARFALREATVLSYNQAFLFIGITVAVVAPCVLLLRPNAGGSGAASASADAH